MSDQPALIADIRALCDEQTLAVLCTVHQGQPFGSLVAFTISEDLRWLCFATERETRKYRNLTAEPRVALLIDSRRGDPDDLEDACALTVSGQVADADADTMQMLRMKHILRHPDLAAFLAQPTTVLVVIAVAQYDFVSHFTQVRTLTMA